MRGDAPDENLGDDTEDVLPIDGGSRPTPPDDRPPIIVGPAAGGGGTSAGGSGGSRGNAGGTSGAAGADPAPTAGGGGAPSTPSAGSGGALFAPTAGSGGAGASSIAGAGAGGTVAPPMAGGGGLAGASGVAGEKAGQGGAGAPAPPKPPACMPSDEQCDNNDNDCDGKIDEGLIDSCDETSMFGECRPGRTTCTAGVWSACQGAVKPRAEACDAVRLDENCDGSRNEGCSCVDRETQGCGKDRGVCRPGTQTCMNGAWGPCVGAVDPQRKEVCDQAREDEDCDGVANPSCECFDQQVEACPGGNDTGECSAGTRTCRNGAWSVCSGARGPSAERCNGLDDDCDGKNDDSPTDCASPKVCSEGRCACVPSCGAQQCGADGCNGTCPYRCAQGQSCNAGRCIMDPVTMPPTCGNGKLDSDEQCDPMIAGGSQVCDSNCKRTVYQTCSIAGTACANNQYCTAFTLDQAAGTSTRPVCSRGCTSDADCPLAQGGSAHTVQACNLGWCVLLCDMDNSCPTGLTCQRLTFFESRDAPGKNLMGCLSP